MLQACVMANNRKVPGKDAEDWDNSASGLFSKMADRIKLLSPDSEDSHWRKIISHKDEIILFYLLDYNDGVPQVSRSVRIQPAPADTIYAGAKLLAHVFTGHQAELSEVLESIPFENPIREVNDIVKILDLVGVFENNNFFGDGRDQQCAKNVQTDPSPQLEEDDRNPDWMTEMTLDAMGRHHLDAAAPVRNVAYGADDHAVLAVATCKTVSAGTNVSSENSAPAVSLALSASGKNPRLGNHESDVAGARQNRDHAATPGQNGASRIKRYKSESADRTNADAFGVPDDCLSNSLQPDTPPPGFSFAGLTMFCGGSFRKAVEKFLIAIQKRERSKVFRKRKRFLCSPELEGVICELDYELRKRSSSSGNKYQREKHELLRRLSSFAGCSTIALSYQLRRSCEKAARKSIRSSASLK